MRKSGGRKSSKELGTNNRTTKLSNLRPKDLGTTKARTIVGGGFAHGSGGGAGKVQMQDFHFGF